ncbi:MAG: ATP-binding cassette domain-containing protein [Burkholderiales bacterium]|nr:ATP-binding cassette domain-containing protein [Burkholderiales bacterium]
MSVVISVAGLCTRYGKQVIHRDLDLTVLDGEVLGIVGGSGSGKTTLLRQMLGLDQPMRGVVKVFGYDLQTASADDLRRMRRHWGVLFQHGALFSALTVFDNVALPLRELRALPEPMIADLAMLKLNVVGIGAEHAPKMPSQLSGGMIKRVALARALALQPELLFLDEPTAGLDPESSESFVELINTLRNELRLTVVMITHDLDTLISLADRVAVLADQRLVAVGALDEIVNIRHPFINSLFHGERGQRALAAANDDTRPPKIVFPDHVP